MKIYPDQYPELLSRMRTTEKRSDIARAYGVSDERIRQIAVENGLPTRTPKPPTPKIPKYRLRADTRHCEIAWDFKVPESIVADQRHAIGVYRGNKSDKVAKRLAKKSYVRDLHNLYLSSSDVVSRHTNVNNAQVKRDRWKLGIMLNTARATQKKQKGQYINVYRYGNSIRAVTHINGRVYQLTAKSEKEAAMWVDLLRMYIKKAEPVNFPRSAYKTKVRNQAKAWFRSKGWL